MFLLNVDCFLLLLAFLLSDLAVLLMFLLSMLL
jgi:hypothetical protein